MPIESPTGSQRPWVAVYGGRTASSIVRHDPPPSYDEVMRILPPSRAIPLQVDNRETDLRPFSAPPHPLEQQAVLQKQLERRQRTQVKLEAACQHLDSVLEEHHAMASSSRAYCGGGLFDDSGECSAIATARREVKHYVKKKVRLQAKLEAQLNRDPAPQARTSAPWLNPG